MRFLCSMLLLLLFIGCTSSRTASEKEIELTKLTDLITSKNFEIIPNSISPMLSAGMIAVSNSGLLLPGNSASRIDISGSASFLKVAGDTVSANLPYFGERQMGGGYNSSTGVKFEGIPKKYEVSKNVKKNYYSIRFSISEKSENYQVFLNLFPDLSGTITINSSQRNAVTYFGYIKKDKS